MAYKRKLTSEQHRELKEQASKGVKLRRLAKDFGLANASSAFKYKWSEVKDDGTANTNTNNSSPQTPLNNSDSAA